jgi:hypothetical protein
MRVCLVEVIHLAAGNRKHGIALTEKEKELLRQLGKITREEIHDAEVNDMPPRYRLACQCFVRNEDIVVAFEGDETLPVQPPYLTPAAKVYKGGVEIASVEEFHGFAVKGIYGEGEEGFIDFNLFWPNMGEIIMAGPAIFAIFATGAIVALARIATSRRYLDPISLTLLASFLAFAPRSSWRRRSISICTT